MFLFGSTNVEEQEKFVICGVKDPKNDNMRYYLCIEEDFVEHPDEFTKLVEMNIDSTIFSETISRLSRVIIGDDEFIFEHYTDSYSVYEYSKSGLSSNIKHEDMVFGDFVKKLLFNSYSYNKNKYEYYKKLNDFYNSTDSNYVPTLEDLEKISNIGS